MNGGMKMKYNSEDFSGNSVQKDMEKLIGLQKRFKEREAYFNKIQEKELEICKLNREISKIENNINNSQNLRNMSEISLGKRNVSFSPDFSISKPIFIALAIISMFLSGFIYNKYAVSIFTSYLVELIISGVICALIPVLIECKSYNDSKKRALYRAQNDKIQAEKYLRDINKHNGEIADKRNKIALLKKETAEIEAFIENNLPVDNQILMPDELKTLDGVSYLLKYMQTGRASSIQEAINLCYREANEERLVQEAYKQTEYAKRQAENARISAENSKRAVALSKEALEASERAADAAEKSAEYERLTYWDNMLNNK